MKKTLIFLTSLTFILSCKKEVLTPMQETVSDIRSGTEKNYGALRFEFKTNDGQIPQYQVGVGNLVSSDINIPTSLCCDGQQTVEFRYRYGDVPNSNTHYIDAFSDTLIDYGVKMATIDIYNYNSIAGGCPSGINTTYTGQNHIKDGKIKWATYVINVPNCHYMNAKLRVFDGAADTLYVQVFKGQPVTMTYNKYWK